MFMELCKLINEEIKIFLKEHKIFENDDVKITHLQYNYSRKYPNNSVFWMHDFDEELINEILKTKSYKIFIGYSDYTKQINKKEIVSNNRNTEEWRKKYNELIEKNSQYGYGYDYFDGDDIDTVKVINKKLTKIESTYLQKIFKLKFNKK